MPNHGHNFKPLQVILPGVLNKARNISEKIKKGPGRVG
jgi:hypothetical protein